MARVNGKKSNWILHVKDFSSSQAVCSKLWTHSDGRELQLAQLDPVNGTDARILLPITKI